MFLTLPLGRDCLSCYTLHTFSVLNNPRSMSRKPLLVAFTCVICGNNIATLTPHHCCVHAALHRLPPSNTFSTRGSAGTKASRGS